MLASCRFETERLEVGEWHAAWAAASVRESTSIDAGLAGFVAAMLSDAVTRPLPEPWHGPYSPQRARRWIAERDAEGTVLLAAAKADGRPLALLLLSELQPASDEEPELRLGYLVAEEAWGSGIASELVAGFVGWCRKWRPADSVAAGVEPENEASVRVLQKAGFERATAEEGADGANLYRLVL